MNESLRITTVEKTFLSELAQSNTGKVRVNHGGPRLPSARRRVSGGLHLGVQRARALWGIGQRWPRLLKLHGEMLLGWHHSLTAPQWGPRNLWLLPSPRGWSCQWWHHHGSPRCLGLDCRQEPAALSNGSRDWCPHLKGGAVSALEAQV